MPADDSLLSDIHLFRLLDADERRTLAAVLDIVSLQAGSTLFRVGDPGDALYVVSHGRIELFIKDHTGDKIVLTQADRGDMFGEVSLLDGGPRAATAIALEDSELLKLDRGDLQQFIRTKPDAALDMLAVMGQRLRHSDELLKGRVTRNANEEIADHRSMLERIADAIAEFSGSIPFLIIHAVLFATWIVLNVPLLPGAPYFDPFPFGLLTMAVSLEAIFLSVFVLLSQNRQAAKDRIRSDIEYDVNLKAELEVAQLHEKVDTLYAEVVGRLQKIESGIDRHNGH